MITCPKCKKFVGKVEFKMDGNEDISDVTGVCKKHGRVQADYEYYEEIVGGEI